MTRTLLPLLLLPLAGCIVVDSAPGMGGMAGTDTAAQAAGDDAGLAFRPETAQPGTTFIAYLVAEDPGLDLSDAARVVLYGDAEVLALDASPAQVVLSIAVPQDAEPGDVDLVVEHADGSASWLEAAFTILPAAGDGDTGGAADGSGDPAGGTSDGAGSDDPCP